VATLLVVDDEWAIADWLDAILSEAGYRVLVASNGRKALETLENEAVDLVLTDFMMPQLDGPGLVSAMKAEPRTRDLPVIIMSSLSEPTVRERLDGHAGFLRKPFREQELFQLLDKVLAAP
jgi:two-component system chemotaxis sensor kinase CheA